MQAAYAASTACIDGYIVSQLGEKVNLVMFALPDWHCRGLDTSVLTNSMYITHAHIVCICSFVCLVLPGQQRLSPLHITMVVNDNGESYYLSHDNT